MKETEIVVQRLKYCIVKEILGIVIVETSLQINNNNSVKLC